MPPSNIQDIIREKQRAMLPTRLLRGAEILGQLWAAGTRCPSGWQPECSCKEPSDFCSAKQRWVAIYLEYAQGAGIDTAWMLFPAQDELGIIRAMTQEQFEMTGVTILVQAPGADAPIKIGPRGTTLETIRNLSALEGTADYASALEAVLRIQRIFK